MRSLCRTLVPSLLLLALAADPASALDRYRLTVKSANDYIQEGDDYAQQYRFGLSAEAYKIAIKKDPANPVAWAKHREAMEKGKAVGDLIRRAQRHLKAGEFEDASRLLQQAVKLNPRDDSVWSLYESALRRNPNVVVILDEREAWEAFKKGKAFLEGNRLEEAKLYFSRVNQTTQDSSLAYYAEKYLEKTEALMKRSFPNEQVHIE
ncbi:MAG: tetratricopeptide repeat protein [Candidatus Wallbacteria bacterium]|nr:tetratricopeptide repeat protein [Candidatus Wallbacteria bacterium]